MTKTNPAINERSLSPENMRSVVLTLDAEPGLTVLVAGTFNDWTFDAAVMADENGDGLYYYRLMLAPGVYEYKFRINDVWLVDPDNPNFTQNSFGTLNSVLEVK